MFRHIVITTAMIAMLIGIYANHQLIENNEHHLKYLNNQYTKLFELQHDIDNFQNTAIENILWRLNKKLDLSVLDSIGIITDGHGHGSCVAIDQNLILTAGHCIDHDNTWVEINGRKYEILKKWKSDKYDVGFLRIKGRVKPLPLGEMPELLDSIYIIGASSDKVFINNISRGIIGKIGIDWSHWVDIIVADASAWWGNSGGPVLNRDGKIIGILVGSVPYSAGISAIEPITHILEVLEGCDI